MTENNRTMSNALHELAPNTTRMFASWLMESYGLSMPEFEKSTPRRKFFEVSRFFGYPLEDNTQLSTPDIIKFIKEKFAEYEAIINKYPEGVLNPMHALKEMDHKTREQWLEKHFKRVINISLRDAIVAGNNMIRVSLRDSIKAIQMTALQVEMKLKREKELADEKFWSDIMKNFNKEEIVPF